MQNKKIYNKSFRVFNFDKIQIYTFRLKLKIKNNKNWTGKRN